MILADKIIVLRGMEDGNFGAITKIGYAVEKAAKYAISRDVAIGACKVAQTKPTSKAAAMAFCRPPFPLTWIEWEFRPLIAVGKYRDENQLDNSKMVVPNRVGILLDMADKSHRQGRMHIVWDYRDDPSKVGMSNGCIEVDWDRTTPPYDKRWGMVDSYEGAVIQKDFPNDLEEVRNTIRETGYFESIKKYADDDEQVAAVARQWSTTSLLPDPYMAEGQRYLRMSGVNIDEMIKLAANDWAGEVSFIEAVLILMNSRSIDYQASDLGRLNKARAKARKPLLQDHQTVVIKLTKTMVERAMAAGIREKDIAKHWVSGHFKTRATGVFWWSPFVRGAKGEEPGSPRNRTIVP